MDAQKQNDEGRNDVAVNVQKRAGNIVSWCVRAESCKNRGNERRWRKSWKSSVKRKEFLQGWWKMDEIKKCRQGEVFVSKRQRGQKTARQRATEWQLIGFTSGGFNIYKVSFNFN